MHGAVHCGATRHGAMQWWRRFGGVAGYLILVDDAVDEVFHRRHMVVVVGKLRHTRAVHVDDGHLMQYGHPCNMATNGGSGAPCS